MVESIALGAAVLALGYALVCWVAGSLNREIAFVWLVLIVMAGGGAYVIGQSIIKATS